MPKRQSTVTLSSTEAELLSLSEAARSLLWWKRFFFHMSYTGYDESSRRPTILCDNWQTVRTMVKDEAIQTRLRHVDIHHHWVRQFVRDRVLGIRWVPTEDMPADDGLTKAVPPHLHHKFVRDLGLVDVHSLLPTDSLNTSSFDS